MISLGCPKTRVDTELMFGLLHDRGWTLVENPEDADAIVVNTCAFLQSSVEESIDTILDMADYKQGKCRRLVVAGCLPSRYGKDLEVELPEVDAFISTHNIPDIVKAIEVDAAGCQYGDVFLSRKLVQYQPSAYLKISEGCNRRCSFCAIPLIRGPQVSRPIDSLVSEARLLADCGVKELVLVAQELTGYGTDLGLKNGLLQLIDELEKIDSIRWIRLMYTYPWQFTDALMERLGEGKVLPYVDIPLQHVSQRILDDMRRHITREAQDTLIHKLRKIPGLILRTSLIAGYPSETEEEFQELCDWVEEIKFDRLGVFAYSPEPGTPAGDREDQIPEEIREQRRDMIMELQQKIQAEKMEALVDTELEVLVEGPSEENPLVMQARYYGQAPEIDGQVYLSYEDTDAPEAKAGDFIHVRVLDASEYDIVGEPIEE